MVTQIDTRNPVPQEDFLRGVIPGLTRNPVVHRWIPAYAGMTGLSMRYILTDYLPSACEPINTGISSLFLQAEYRLVLSHVETN